MKITKEELANIIKEEVENALSEQEDLSAYLAGLGIPLDKDGNPTKRPPLPKDWRSLPASDVKRQAFRMWYTEYGPGSKRKKTAAKPAPKKAKSDLDKILNAPSQKKAPKKAAAKNDIDIKIDNIVRAYNRMVLGREGMQKVLWDLNNLVETGKIDRKTWWAAYNWAGADLVREMKKSAKLNNAVIDMLKGLKQQDPSDMSKVKDGGRELEEVEKAVVSDLQEQLDVQNIITKIVSAYNEMFDGRQDLRSALWDIRQLVDDGKINRKAWHRQWYAAYNFSDDLLDATNKSAKLNNAVIDMLEKLKQET